MGRFVASTMRSIPTSVKQFATVPRVTSQVSQLEFSHCQFYISLIIRSILTRNQWTTIQRCSANNRTPEYSVHYNLHDAKPAMHDYMSLILHFILINASMVATQSSCSAGHLELKLPDLVNISWCTLKSLYIDLVRFDPYWALNNIQNAHVRDVGYDSSTWSSSLEVIVYENHRQLSVVPGLKMRANHWGPSPTLHSCAFQDKKNWGPSAALLNVVPFKTIFVMYSRNHEK